MRPTPVAAGFQPCRPGSVSRAAKFGSSAIAKGVMLSAMPLAVADLTKSRREILIVPRLVLEKFILYSVRRDLLATASLSHLRTRLHEACCTAGLRSVLRPLRVLAVPKTFRSAEFWAFEGCRFWDWLCPDRCRQRPDTYDAHHPRHIVGQHVQCHL